MAEKICRHGGRTSLRAGCRGCDLRPLCDGGLGAPDRVHDSAQLFRHHLREWGANRTLDCAALGEGYVKGEGANRNLILVSAYAPDFLHVYLAMNTQGRCLLQVALADDGVSFPRSGAP